MNRLFFGTSTLLALILTAWSYPSLPQRVPLHFGTSGMPDAWGSKTTWMLICIALILGTWFLFWGIGRWIQRVPSDLINVPRKDYWLQPENIAEFHRRFRNYLDFFGGACQVFYIIIGLLTFNAQQHNTGINTLWFLVAVTGFLVLTGIWIWIMVSEFNNIPAKTKP